MPNFGGVGGIKSSDPWLRARPSDSKSWLHWESMEAPKGGRVPLTKGLLFQRGCPQDLPPALPLQVGGTLFQQYG